MNIQFIKTPEKRRITEKLNEQFGIEKLPYLLIESGKEKIRAFSGSLSKEEILILANLTNIENIGLYFLKKENEIELRITLDAIHLIKNQINKNVIEINDQQLQDWLRGKDLDLAIPWGVYIVKHNNDFIGYTKSTGSKLINFIPKERRLKK